jgi:C4-dicarboxylate transporter, DctQ subunit
MNPKRPARLAALFDRILDVTPVLASILLYFMMLAVCYEVVMRTFFNMPTAWVTEITSLTLLWIPFLVGAWISRKNAHIRMDLVLGQFSERRRAVIDAVTLLVTAATCAVLVIYGVKSAWQFFQDSYRTETLLRLAKWPLVSIIPLGFFLLLVESVRKAVRSVKRVRNSTLESGPTGQMGPTHK